MQLRNGVCIVAIALGGGLASTVAVADEMFLKFGGIPGDSTDPQHPNEIVVLSYSIGVTADTRWTSGGGASVGAPKPGDLHFTAAMNRSVPTILKYITQGKAATTALLTVRSGNSGIPGPSTPVEYAKYTFEGFFFTSVDQSLNGVGRAVSAVSGVYKTVQVQYFVPGNPVPVSCVIWNIPSGAAGDC